MKKNEYLQRVFESQISSLKNNITYIQNEIDELNNQLKELELDLKGDLDLLKYAEEEMSKLR